MPLPPAGPLCAAAALFAAPAIAAAPQERAAAEPAAAAVSLVPPPLAEVRAAVNDWAAAKLRGDEDENAEPAEPPPALAEALAAWENADAALPPADRLDLLARTLRAGDPAIDELLAAVDPFGPPIGPDDDLPDVDAAVDSSDEWVRDHLRLLVGRGLTRAGSYDEALSELGGLDPANLIDPATLVFCRAVCEHQLLMREEALESVGTLLANAERVPEPAAALAALMKAELDQTEPDSLREVSAMMRDVERRLDRGRSGPRVRKREDEIVARLDQIIEKLQAQAGGGGGGEGAQQSQSNQSQAPGSDSALKGGDAVGEADDKPADGAGGWGDLPPKEQARAKALLDRQYPGHYRRVVEEYFRRAAEEDR